MAKVDFQAWLEKAREFDVNDIENVDWQNMGSWPLPGKVFFAVLLFVGLLAGGYFLLVQGQIQSLTALEKKEEQLKQEFMGKAFRAANLDEYRQQLEVMERDFGALLQQLPKDTEVPGLLDDISTAAFDAGLQLNAIDPNALTRTEFYNELPIDIEVVGDYHSMGRFVSAVSALPRIVTLHDFSISQLADRQLQMKIQAKTYQYNGDR